MAKGIRNVVVAVASGDPIDPVLRPAIALADQLGATLHAIHTFELPAPVLEAYARLGFEGEEIGTEYVRRTAAQIEKAARDLDPASEIRVQVSRAAAAEEVARYASEVEADLVLVGSTHRGKVGRALLGTTAERIIRRAGLPVLVVRDGKEITLSRILLTTDLSPESGPTFEAAVDIAKMLGEEDRMEMRALYTVWHGATLPPPIRDEFVREVLDGEMADYLQERGALAAGIEKRVRIGTAAHEIASEGRDWDADLVVVGTHGRRGLNRLLFGSVAAAVVRDAPCHALIVPVSTLVSEATNPAVEVAAG